MLNKARRLYEFGPFQIDPDHRQLLRENQPVPLQPKAFDILLALVENSGNVVSKDDLLKRVWPDTFVEEANLSQHIFVLRKTLGDTVEDKRYIVTVPGRGYQLAQAVRAITADEEIAGAESNEAEIVVASRSSATLVIERGKSTDLRLWIAAGAMLAAIAVAAGLYWRSCGDLRDCATKRELCACLESASSAMVAIPSLACRGSRAPCDDASLPWTDGKLPLRDQSQGRRQENAHADGNSAIRSAVEHPAPG